MDTYSKAFEEAIAALPQTLLADLIKNKLDAQGVKLSKKKLTLLVANILKGEPTNCVSFLDRIKKKLGVAVREATLEFTDEDFKAVERALEEYMERLPQTVQDVVEQSSTDLLELLKTDWRSEAKRLKSEREAFKKRLHERWGDGISLLRMLITIAREVGSEIHMSGRKATDAPLSLSVLTRLHARACQIAEEIVCLLEGGFADGAMARWRTLHEISAVSALIHEHGEELAERYMEHDAIENARAARQYQKYHGRLGVDAIAADEIQEIEERAKALKDKYGKEFGSSNGWAAKHLGIVEPKIDQLIAAAKIDHLLPYYKLASTTFTRIPEVYSLSWESSAKRKFFWPGRATRGLPNRGITRQFR